MTKALRGAKSTRTLTALSKVLSAPRERCALPVLPFAGLWNDHLRRDVGAFAVRTGAVNLGQGFPDEDGPPIVEAAVEAIRGARISTARTRDSGAASGHRRSPRRFWGLACRSRHGGAGHPGATEGLAAACFACAPGDR